MVDSKVNPAVGHTVRCIGRIWVVSFLPQDAGTPRFCQWVTDPLIPEAGGVVVSPDLSGIQKEIN